jgi:hypothetical protein
MRNWGTFIWGTSNIEHRISNAEGVGLKIVGWSLPASNFRAAFPLTPALSLGEREMLCHASRELMTVDSILRRSL